MTNCAFYLNNGVSGEFSVSGHQWLSAANGSWVRWVQRLSCNPEAVLQLGHRPPPYPGQRPPVRFATAYDIGVTENAGLALNGPKSQKCKMKDQLPRSSLCGVSVSSTATIRIPSTTARVDGRHSPDDRSALPHL